MTHQQNKEAPDKLINERESGNRSAVETQKETTQYVVFAVHSEEYAVNITEVLEIKQWEEPTRIPSPIPWVMGVINLRGTIIPVLNLREAFEKKEKHKICRENIIVIVQHGKEAFGLFADKVIDIIRYDAGKIDALPEVRKGD